MNHGQWFDLVDQVVDWDSLCAELSAMVQINKRPETIFQSRIEKPLETVVFTVALAVLARAYFHFGKSGLVMANLYLKTQGDAVNDSLNCWRVGEDTLDFNGLQYYMDLFTRNMDRWDRDLVVEVTVHFLESIFDETRLKLSTEEK